MKLVAAIDTLCEFMQQTDANEFCLEAGTHGGKADGARYYIRIIRQCPECAVEQEDEE